MKKYLISIILFSMSGAAFADFDLRRVNKDPKIQAMKEKCAEQSPRDHRGVIYKRPFRQCMIDSGVMVGNFKNKTTRSQIQFTHRDNKPINPQTNQNFN